MKRFNLFILLLTACVAMSAQISSDPVKILVKPVKGDATAALRHAIDKARTLSGKQSAVIVLRPGAVYDISRSEATSVLYHVSNTTSVTENSTPVKHIGLLLRGMSDVVIDGCGATLRTHGEMTPWVIDSCCNIEICNLTVEAADPTVPEMTVETVDSLSFTARVHPTSRYQVRDNKLYWQGEGWEFTDGIAQIYDPVTQTTRRCPSPVVQAIAVSELSPGLLRFDFNRHPDAVVGQIYQMRHSLRTEVAGLITRSENVTLSDINLHFMGNFGIVAQTSTDLTYRRLHCEPDSLSGRTCAGFADFLQVSGCRGRVDISDCRFSGSQDDPINIHGTHLRVSDWGDRRSLTVTYMHPQTFGFQSFFPGDTVEIVNPASLLPVASAVVTESVMTDDYNIILNLDRQLPPEIIDLADAVVENVSWTPEVRITGCHFRATPTRGILVTTRRPVLIADNIFERTPMAAILVADDARSWYESGPVNDLTIRDNLFVDCSLPVIQFAPEISRYDGPVHSNISITGNRFEYTSPRRGSLIFMRAADNVTITGNHLDSPVYMPFTLTLESTTNTTLE